MKRDIKKCLFDIQTSIQSIQDYLAGERNYFTFKQNKQLRRAIEREIEIIGEAVNRILKIDPAFRIENARQIIDTRNFVIHAYDNVDDVIIWGIVSIHLPKLGDEEKPTWKRNDIKYNLSTGI